MCASSFSHSHTLSRSLSLSLCVCVSLSLSPPPPPHAEGHVAYFYEANVLGVLELPCPALNRLSPTLFGGQSRSDLFDSIRVNRTERVRSSGTMLRRC